MWSNPNFDPSNFNDIYIMYKIFTIYILSMNLRKFIIVMLINDTSLLNIRVQLSCASSRNSTNDHTHLSFYHIQGNNELSFEIVS